MLFRTKTGELKEIKKLDYLTDTKYINEIIKVYNIDLDNNNDNNNDINLNYSAVNKFLKEYNIPQINN